MRKIKGILGPEIPVDVISPMAYGRCDGSAVLEHAEELGGKK